MKKILIILLVALTALLLIGFLVNIGPDEENTIIVEMKNNKGDASGTINLAETKAGVMLYVDLEGLTPDGEHGFHVHETADCTPIESFTNAGGHYNPKNSAHGMKHPDGQHAGDMPNLVADDKGKIARSILNINVTLDDEKSALGRGSLFDEDGSALIIHANADDHMSQPSGAAGPRILCGEIKRTN